MNSSSGDGTVACAEELGAETLVISRDAFNHGISREKARRYLQTEIVVMMTPDAYALDETMLTRLIDPLIKKKASVAYARQIPHDGASFFAALPRAFNYPEKSQIRSYEDRHIFGAYTIFCSNSCAAYLSDAVEEAGGFPSVLIGEDTFLAAKMLRRGHKIAYVADAIVKHSHSYSLWQEFQRHFDTGLARKQHQDLLFGLPSDEKRGREYVLFLMNRLAREKPHLLPYGCLQTAVKYFGYRFGKASARAPVWLKKLCSGQDFYWHKT